MEHLNFIVSGIYKIINKMNGKFYIGSSNDIYKRWIKHKGDLNAQRHHNKYLQKAWNKYGEGCFIFEIVEVVDDVSNLQNIEQIWLDNTKCYIPTVGYNISQYADRPNYKSTISITRTDINLLFRNHVFDKNEGYFLFFLSAFLSKDNLIKINGKLPNIDVLCSSLGYKKTKIYDLLKTLENKLIIKKKKSYEGYLIYVNPYLFQFNKNIDKEIYNMFSDFDINNF